DHDGNLDRTCGAHTLIRIERIRLTSVEVFGKQTDFAFKRGDDRFHPIVQCLLCLSGCRDGNEKKDQKYFNESRHKIFILFILKNPVHPVQYPNATSSSALRIAAPAAPRIVL